jgi:hypothetical protein
MQYKYRVDILDNETSEIKESWEFKTKRDISESYSIPMYMIDKIIKKTNDPKFSTKRKSHMVYKELMQSMRIELIKPQF